MSPKLPVGTVKETRRAGAPSGDRAGEIIDDLRDDARPIDRIDARQAQRVAEGKIVEQAFEDGLAIVEIAFERDRVDVGFVDRRHLPALHVGDAAVRIEDEDVGLRLAAESLDRGGAGVAGSGADDRRPRAALLQHMVHQPAEPLHGEILERQRRAMKQFEHEEIVVDLDERRFRRVAKAGIGRLAPSRQVRVASSAPPMKGSTTLAAACA